MHISIINQSGFVSKGSDILSLLASTMPLNIRNMYLSLMYAHTRGMLVGCSRNARKTT